MVQASASVEREIRHDIQRYELEHRTPMDFGVRIASHPKLAITSAARMRAAVPAEVPYSGRRLQTIRFRHRDAGWLHANLSAACALVAAALTDRVTIERNPAAPVIALLRNVASGRIREFIRAYRFSERSSDLNSNAIDGYIAAKNATGELQTSRSWAAAAGALRPRETRTNQDGSLARPTHARHTTLMEVWGRCPCGGTYEPRRVEVRMTVSSEEVVFPSVAQGLCPKCGSRVYQGDTLCRLEALLHELPLALTV